MRHSAPLIAACIGWAACGSNEVVIEIEGGDGQWLRLDVQGVRMHHNRLGRSGTTTFAHLHSDEYSVSVVAGEHVETRRLKIDSPPVAGVARQVVEFSIPPGANRPFERTGTIVYAAEPTRVRNWDLFTVDVATGEILQLTDSRDFEQHPRWSPDGRRILFTMGDVMTNIDIWVMDSDGGGRRRLTEHAERDQEADWSPDGRQIAFVSQREGDVAIYLMDSDGGNKRKLVQGREPSWSPDGRRIAFTSSAFEGNDEVYLINTDGTGLRRLTEHKKIDQHPAWSPDGLRLVMASGRFGGQELLVAGGDLTDQVRVTVAEHTFELGPAWSPDGRGLAYSGKMKIGDDGEVVTDKRGRSLGTYDIYLLPASGFDWDVASDEAPARPVMPINLTQTNDWDEYSPDWRAF